MRHRQLAGQADGAQGRAELRHQEVEALPRFGRNRHRRHRPALLEPLNREPAALTVDFVQDHQGRFFQGVHFPQGLVDALDLLLRLRMADIHHVQKEIGTDDLFQSRLEGIDQLVREFADEAYRIGEQYVLIGRQMQAPGGRVQRREKFILGQNRSSGQCVKKGRFARIGIADD